MKLLLLVLQLLFLEIDVGRAAAPPPPPSPGDDATLQRLTLAAVLPGTLSPVFSAKTTSYKVVLAPGTATMTIAATPTDTAATMQVTASCWPQTLPNWKVDLASGAASPAVNLSAATTTTTIEVTSADRNHTQSYTVQASFVRCPAAVVGLRSLSFTAGGKPLKMVPAFNASMDPKTMKLPYTLAVPDGLNQVELSAATTANCSFCTVHGVAAPVSALAVPLDGTHTNPGVVVLCSDKATSKVYNIQLNSTNCITIPVTNAEPCKDTFIGAKCEASCRPNFALTTGAPSKYTCTKVQWGDPNTTQFQWVPDATGLFDPGRLPRVCDWKPVPPLPTGGTWKCMNGSSSAGKLDFTSGNVTRNGLVIFNSSVFNGFVTTAGYGRPVTGCTACGCCLDYISDCEGCVRRCYENASGTTSADGWHFGCSGLPAPPHSNNLQLTLRDQRRPPPAPPVVCQPRPGPRNPCLNNSAPQVSSMQMQFSSMRCDGVCGNADLHANPPSTPAFPPQRLGEPWVCSPKIRTATENSSTWTCTVCDACCRLHIDCVACVKARCPSAGAAFGCVSGHCQTAISISSSSIQGARLFSDLNCSVPLGGGTPLTAPACVPLPPILPNNTRFGKNHKCFGKKCLLLATTYPLGDFRSADCNKSCGHPVPPPPRPPTPPTPPPPPLPQFMTFYSLNDTDPQAVCLDGRPASVYSYINTVNKSNLWVILIGTTSSGLDICIDEPNCAQMAARVWQAVPGAPPPPPPSPIPLSSGPMSQDCAINPDWCVSDSHKHTTYVARACLVPNLTQR